MEKNSRGLNSALKALVKAKVGTRMLLNVGECLVEMKLILGNQEVWYDLNRALVKIENEIFGFVTI